MRIAFLYTDCHSDAGGISYLGIRSLTIVRDKSTGDVFVLKLY